MARFAISSIALGFLVGVPAVANPASPCDSSVGSPSDIKELRPGILQGYLEPKALPDSLKLLPAPPKTGSPADLLDLARAKATIAIQGSPRWELATIDADLHFPAAAKIFSCALGVPISQETTPRLYTLLRRTLTDAGLATYRAKTHYQRPRPFMRNGQAICTPNDEAKLREDGSYPSGHTSGGWAWALILSEMAPERRDQLISRGIEYGNSRSICNVHWSSDVEAGRLIGSATVAQLHADPVFRADLKAASAEIKALRMRGLPANGNCSLETQAFN